MSLILKAIIAENWKWWIGRFKLYITGMATKAQSMKCSTSHIVGVFAVQVYNSLSGVRKRIARITTK